MRLHNKTKYNYIAVINGKKYAFAKNDVIDFEYIENTKVELKCQEKSSTHFDWISILALQMFIGSTTITNIYADYSFVINSAENQIIDIVYNDWHPREQINIKACCAGTNVINEEYSLPKLEKIQKKHRNFHYFVSNALPIGIACLVFCFLTDPPILFIILFIVWLLMFELPSLKEIKRFKQIADPKYFNDKLCEYAANKREYGFNHNEDISKTGKIMEKIIAKMFKFDEDKE